MLEEIHIDLPASNEAIASLPLGSVVYLTGTVYTAREGVYHRVLNEGHPLPSGLADRSNVNFHCSPAAAKNEVGGFDIGGVTATASFRFSQYLAQWLDLTGTKVIIGKGGIGLCGRARRHGAGSGPWACARMAGQLAPSAAARALGRFDLDGAAAAT